jgi:hypothetical protein
MDMDKNERPGQAQGVGLDERVAFQVWTREQNMKEEQEQEQEQKQEARRPRGNEERWGRRIDDP